MRSLKNPPPSGVGSINRAIVSHPQYKRPVETQGAETQNINENKK